MMKNLTITKAILYTSFIITFVISGFFDKTLLQLVMPMVLIAIIIDYLYKNSNINLYAVLGLISLIFTDYFLYVDIVSHFSKICIFITIYMVLAVYSLRKYFNQIQIQFFKMISWSLIISLLLIIYLIFSVSELVIHMLPGSLPYILISVVALLTYIAISYCIYISDYYKGGFQLIVSASLLLLSVTLSPINELYYPSDLFLVLVTSSHIASLIIYMNFIKETDPFVPSSLITKFI
ncbi:hypothetical protein NBT05_14750 [Aquimarina sp. ERC-38]|uniref:hypothetical protein n=1 Tax=Aquimarina sp. ERC-38 TaxID=2949996 RepID=UPI002245ACFB|nr:hypothetical protein [Aquimarina sp. ERC-38]UZO80200.1 hypothetical protein NBT05_14750 [Aquimarina sp. ERC-38]